MKKNEGFSLLELIIAMTILSIITMALWGNFFTSIVKGRDSRRKQDLESIAKALELYYFDKKFYPASVSWGSPLVNPDNTNVIYMQQVPQDPSSSYSYCYRTDVNHTKYQLYAVMENTNDSKVFSQTVDCDASPPGNPPQILKYNYGISSSNTSPQSGDISQEQN